MIEFEIWWTDGKTSEISERKMFSSQEEAEAYVADMDFEDNAYWVQLSKQHLQPKKKMNINEFVASLSDQQLIVLLDALSRTETTAELCDAADYLADIRELL